jgi:hypothetical protein
MLSVVMMPKGVKAVRPTNYSTFYLEGKRKCQKQCMSREASPLNLISNHHNVQSFQSSKNLTLSSPVDGYNLEY